MKPSGLDHSKALGKPIFMLIEIILLIDPRNKCFGLKDTSYFLPISKSRNLPTMMPKYIMQ